MVEFEKDSHANSQGVFHLPAAVDEINCQSAGETDAPEALEKAAAVVGAITAVAPPAVVVGVITAVAPPAAVAASAIEVYLSKALVVKEPLLPENATAASVAAATYSTFGDLGIIQKKATSLQSKY